VFGPQVTVSAAQVAGGAAVVDVVVCTGFPLPSTKGMYAAKSNALERNIMMTTYLLIDLLVVCFR
jgi:hypothetical protein